MIDKSKERTRRWRERGTRQQRVVTVRLDPEDIKRLIERGYLTEADLADIASGAALSIAAETFLSDMLAANVVTL